jgi:hypothetical protein
MLKRYWPVFIKSKTSWEATVAFDAGRYEGLKHAIEIVEGSVSLAGR